MNTIITKKVRLIPAPFVGTRIRIKLDDPESLTWGMNHLTLADGHDKAIIDWGDGRTDELAASGALTHNFASVGEYMVRVSDDIISLRCSIKSDKSAFKTIYAPMIREFRTNATHLNNILSACFYAAENLSIVSCKGSGLMTLHTLALANCPSLAGRLDLPGISYLYATTLSESLGITELHFSKANEEEITALSGFDTAFGALNAVIVFDL